MVPNEKGFSTVELLVGVMIGVVVLGGTVALLRQSADVGSMVTLRGETQQSLRAGLNLVGRDLSMAGTGFPMGGIQLPAGNGAVRSRFACDTEACHLLENLYGDDRLYAITPGFEKGPVINGVTTDVVTVAYRDTDLNLDQYPLEFITPSGNQIRIDPLTDPPITDPVVGVAQGDVLVLCNVNGCAVGAVTSMDEDNKINFAASDPLRFNQPSAAFGNIASLANPGTPAGQYPPTRAFRIEVITYYIDVNAERGESRLIRQVNAHPPAPIADHVEDLRFLYDLFDENEAVVTTELGDAGGFPNQIRKVNIQIGVRSGSQGLFGRGFHRQGLSTSVSARNMAFRSRYE